MLTWGQGRKTTLARLLSSHRREPAYTGRSAILPARASSAKAINLLAIAQTVQSTWLRSGRESDEGGGNRPAGGATHKGVTAHSAHLLLFCRSFGLELRHLPVWQAGMLGIYRWRSLRTSIRSSWLTSRQEQGSACRGLKNDQALQAARRTRRQARLSSKRRSQVIPLQRRPSGLRLPRPSRARDYKGKSK